MKTVITKNEFEAAQIKMNELLTIVTQKGGFDNISQEENTALEKYTQIIKAYEEVNCILPFLKND